MKITKKNNLEITELFLLMFILSKTGFFVSSIIEYGSLLAFSCLVTLQIIKRKTFIVTKQTAYYLLFGGYACFSYVWAMSKSFALETIPTILALTVFMIVLSNYIDNKEKLRTIIKYLVLANVLVSFKVLVFYFLKAGTPADKIISITGIHFNTVGQVIGFSILFSIYLYQVYKNKIYLYSIIPQITTILLTTSRKSLLIPVLGIFFVLLLEKRLSKMIKYFFIMLAGIGIFSVCNQSLMLNIMEKLGDLFKYTLGAETTDWSINLRDFFIQTGTEIFKSNPIVGLGINNFSYYVEVFTSYGVARYSHNNYIELLSCLGTIGFILYYWIYFYLLLKLRKKASQKNVLHTIAFAALIVLIIMEWGIVSYTGCIYHMYLSVIYYTLWFGEDIILKKVDRNG